MKRLFNDRLLWLLFTISAFSGAALLFASEPMVGKILLPLFGGSPAVWNACVLFFQVLLLAGYAYAHFATTKFALKTQVRLHIGLLCIVLLLPTVWPNASQQVSSVPVLHLLAILTTLIGAPFFVLATTGPLLQRWFAATTHPNATRPYFLYAAGNLGSFAALLSYPFLIEPHISLRDQNTLWSIGYGIFVVLMAACAMALFARFKKPAAAKKVTATPITNWQRAAWVFLAFIPSSLMLGTTTFITSDVASVPLLWIIPLSIYLLTFVAAFSWRNPLGRVQRLAPLAALGIFGSTLLMGLPDLPFSPSLRAILFVLTFTAIALVAHGRLALSKPPATKLTEFYLWVSVGGACGGLLNTFVAPWLFNDIYEFPLVLLLSVCTLLWQSDLVRLKKWASYLTRLPQLPRRLLQSVNIMPFLAVVITYGAVAYIVAHNANSTLDRFADVLFIAPLAALFFVLRYERLAGIVALFLLAIVPLLNFGQTPALLSDRTFYGILEVKKDGDAHVLMHGVTEHGRQYTAPEKAGEPLTYYHQEGPVGDVMQKCREQSDCHSIGVVGLGTGTMAAYGKAGDNMTFYEIDPAVIDIANNPAYFTFLKSSAASVHTQLGDGRLALESTPPQTFDVLVVDAFSSDAIPTHMLTKEALQIYARAVKPDGVIALHISNRQLQLEPIVAATAKEAGLHGMIRRDDNGDMNRDYYPSEWAVLAKTNDALQPFAQKEGWRDLEQSNSRPWTDDYSNVLDAFRLY